MPRTPGNIKCAGEGQRAVGEMSAAHSVGDLRPFLELAVLVELQAQVLPARRRGNRGAHAHADTAARPEGAASNPQTKRNPGAATERPFSRPALGGFANDGGLP